MKCEICKRKTKTKLCEVKGIYICKDCCINGEGYDCRWWLLCHGMDGDDPL